MKVYEHLTKDNWIQGKSAVDIDGNQCLSTDPEAIGWCLYGSINYCYNNNLQRWNIIEKIYNHLQQNLTVWNNRDYRTYEDVVALAKELDI